MSSVVFVDSGIRFQLVKLPNIVGWTAHMQKSIQSVSLGYFLHVVCVFA